MARPARSAASGRKEPVTQPLAARKSPFGADLAPRAISGIVLIAAALAAAYWGGLPFAIFWLVAFGAVAWEWQRLSAKGGAADVMRAIVCWAGLTLAVALTTSGLIGWAVAAVVASGIVAAFVGGSFGADWRLAGSGALYAGFPLIAVLALRGQSREGQIAIFWVFAVVWTTDIGAYFVGRLLGGPKLWPSISPGKTWSGAIGGLVLGAGAGLAFAGSTNDPYVLGALGLGVSLTSQAGDLFESALKRRYGVKDSGNLIPGHGGIMDRLDGFLAAVVLAAIVAWVNAEGANIGAGLFAW